MGPLVLRRAPRVCPLVRRRCLCLDFACISTVKIDSSSIVAVAVPGRSWRSALVVALVKRALRSAEVSASGPRAAGDAICSESEGACVRAHVAFHTFEGVGSAGSFVRSAVECRRHKGFYPRPRRTINFLRRFLFRLRNCRRLSRISLRARTRPRCPCSPRRPRAWRAPSRSRTEACS